MIKIGDKELCFSTTLLMTDEQEAEIVTVVDDWELKITIALVQKSNEEKSISWSAVTGNHARIEFCGWRDSLGSATASPVYIGVTDTSNRAVGFGACHHRVGTVNRLDFQIYLGGVYE